MHLMLSFLILFSTTSFVSAQAAGSIYLSSDCTLPGGPFLPVTFNSVENFTVNEDACQGFDDSYSSLVIKGWNCPFGTTPALIGFSDVLCSNEILRVAGPGATLAHCYAPTGAGLRFVKLYCLGDPVSTSALTPSSTVAGVTTSTTIAVSMTSVKATLPAGQTPSPTSTASSSTTSSPTAQKYSTSDNIQLGSGLGLGIPTLIVGICAIIPSCRNWTA